MKHSLLFFTLAAFAALAQGPRGPMGSGAPGQNAGLDMSKATTVEGAVTAVSIAYGAQYPSITVGTTQVKVAPVWYMIEKDFEIATGMTLRVTAAPSLAASDAYLHAVQIVNTKTNAAITLRNADGVPLWVSGRGQQSRPSDPPRTGGGCIDPASIKTASGAVDRVSAGAGIQMPSLALKLADGSLLTVKIGPERILLAGDFEIAAGDKLTVKYALATCNEELVALQLTNAAGKSILLRDDDGSPVWD